MEHKALAVELKRAQQHCDMAHTSLVRPFFKSCISLLSIWFLEVYSLVTLALSALWDTPVSGIKTNHSTHRDARCCSKEDLQVDITHTHTHTHTHSTNRFL